LCVSNAALGAPAPDDTLKAAQNALDKGDFASAHQLLENAINEKPDDPELRFLAARAARRFGNFEDAEKHLRKFERLRPSSEALDLERKLLLAQRGDLTEVEESLSALAKKDSPDSPLIFEALCRGSWRSFQAGHAFDYLDQWLRRQPDNVQALVLRGQLWESIQAHKEAVANFRRALELDPDSVSARLSLARALHGDGNAEEAIDHFEHLRKSNPENSEVLVGLAGCQHDLGASDKARELLNAVLTKEPRNTAALTAFGRVELQVGEPAKAETSLRKAIKLEPTNREAIYSLVLCLRQLDKEIEAKEYLDRYQRLDGDLKRLNVLLMKVTDSPKDADPLHEAGAILLRLSREDEGLRCLRQALKVDPKHRATHAALADYYEKKGDKDRAADHRKQSK
jgi:predicted Zn-dependent protease